MPKPPRIKIENRVPNGQAQFPTAKPVKTEKKGAFCCCCFPFLRHRRDPLPKPVNVHSLNSSMQARSLPGTQLRINASVKITGASSAWLIHPVRPAQQVAGVDKECFQAAACILAKDGLAIIGVPAAYIEKPHQPKTFAVSDPRKS